MELLTETDKVGEEGRIEVALYKKNLQFDGIKLKPLYRERG